VCVKGPFYNLAGTCVTEILSLAKEGNLYSKKFDFVGRKNIKREQPGKVFIFYMERKRLAGSRHKDAALCDGLDEARIFINSRAGLLYEIFIE